jgi:hydrogenase maturation protease
MNPAGNQRIVVVGVGNTLMRDDGVGVHALRELQKNPPAAVELVEAGTAVWGAESLLHGADRLLILDAVVAGYPAGTVCQFNGMEAAAERGMRSLHSLGILDVLALGGREGLPGEVRVLGVEPHVVDYGLELSPAVLSALPELVAAACRLVAAWRAAPRPARSVF